MKKVYYIRHGESEANVAKKWGGHTNSPLTAQGQEQAILAAKIAKQNGLKFDLIISSPLSRAYQTATYIAKEYEYEESKIIKNDLFKERFYGELDGQDYGKLYDLLFEDETIIDNYNSAEPLLELYSRAKKSWELIKSTPQDSILIVSHGAFGRSLLRVVRGEEFNAPSQYIENAKIKKIYDIKT